MRPPHNVWIIPSEIKRGLAKKYGVKPFFVISLYHTFWMEVRRLLRTGLEDYLAHGEDSKLTIPHIGEFHIDPKTLRYLRLKNERILRWHPELKEKELKKYR